MRAKNILLGASLLVSPISVSNWVAEQIQDPQEQLLHVLEQQPVSLDFQRDTISLWEAIKLWQQEAKLQDTLHIYYVGGARKPLTFEQYQKDHIVYHGAANSTESSLIYTGYENVDFAYAILKNGVVIEFFDPKYWQAGTWAFGSINGDANQNAKWIGIEFSGKLIDVPVEKRKFTGANRDVEEPNEFQIHSAKLLVAYLEQYFDKRFRKTTHYDVVKNVDSSLYKRIHTDGQTRSKELKEQLSVDSLYNISFDLSTITERLETLLVVQQKLWSSHYTTKALEYWEEKYNQTLYEVFIRAISFDPSLAGDLDQEVGQAVK